MERNVLYSATKGKFYELMKVSIKSLLINNPEVDNIYILGETDDIEWKYNDFPKIWTDKIKMINLNKQFNYFLEDTPVWNHEWFHHIVLSRLAAPKYLPNDIHTILYLDVDTIINDNLDPIFRMDLTNKPCAMCKEKRNPNCGKEPYYNSGVVYFNLDYIRENNIADKWIAAANSGKFYQYPDQDIINEICYGQIVPMDLRYNELITTQISNNPGIVHYAGDSNWYSGASCPRAEWYDKYNLMPIPLKLYCAKKSDDIVK